ncbi:MAG: fused MFS/spermidine synthase [Candidatus Methylomirabilis oxyfera]|nr:fused MFS/spermidine synthase [Candidatus Methylomirabilis oxyfera]
MGDPKMGQRLPRAALAAVYACFFLSGATGLAYEIVWMRMLSLVFGHTVFAITGVLAAFMAGLALGAFLFGRLIDRHSRPLRIYGLLEAGIGVFCLMVPFLLTQAERVYLALYRGLSMPFFTFSLVQFALVFLILLVPTTLMGATLPVLSKFFVEKLEGVGQEVGELYSLNTFGAVVGSGAAGFFLLPAIGVNRTIVLAAAINLVIAAITLLIDRAVRRPASPAVKASRGQEKILLKAAAAPLPLSSRLLALILYGIGLSGTASMIYEVAWTRALSLVVGSSIYAFSAMLTTFLVGLALGSFLFARIWGKRQVGPMLFGGLEVAAGFAALAVVPIIERLPDLVLGIMKRMSPSPGGALLTQFSLSFLVMIVPTTILGSAFPCAVQICARALPRLGRDIGQVYSANTVGTIGGALLAGFLLIPRIGAQPSMMGAAALNVAVGVIVLAASAKAQPLWRRVAVVPLPLALVFIAGVVLLPRWDWRVMVGGASIYVRRFASEADPAAQFRREAASRQLVFYREGINSTVAVERTERLTSLKVDGKVDATNGSDMTTQLLLGHVPILLHPRPERVLIIGLGSGVTAGAVAQHPLVREIDVVELEPAVVEASNFFAQENRGVLRDPRVRVVIGDGRNVILGSSKRYDVISSEPSNPWIAGVANLFSEEFYRLARRRLADDGIMAQWVQGYSLFPRDLKMILNTFRQVFPHSTLWRTLQADYLLVGTASPLRVDYALLERRIAGSPTVREDMASLRLGSALDLLTLFVMDEAALARFVQGSPVNTDDKPLLEFAAPMSLYADTAEENYRLLREAQDAKSLFLTNLPDGLLEARRLHFARAYWSRGEKEEALEQLRRVARRGPGDVASRLEHAKLLFSLGEIAQATEELTRLARLRPHDRLLSSYLKAGAILRELKVEEAVAQHSRTQSGDPNPAEAHNNLGVFYTRLGIRHGEPAFFDLAVDALQAALQMEPQSSPVLNNLGNAYLESGRLEEATRVYRRVIELAPRLVEARFNLGLVYKRQGAFDLAAREFEAAIALRPDWGPPRMQLRALRAGPAPSAGAGRHPGGVRATR